MPNWKEEILNRLAGLKLAPAREAEIAEELSQHLEDRFHELVSKGLSEAETRQSVLEEFCARSADELTRGLRRVEVEMNQEPVVAGGGGGGNFFSSLLQDIRYGARMLVKKPAVTAAAVIALALGIGANTAIFSVVNGVLLRPLPYRDPGRVVVVSLFNQKSGGTFPLCDADYLDWRAQNHSFSSVSAFSGTSYNVTGSGEPVQILGVVVTSDFFTTLGVMPLVGRTFLPGEDQPGSPPLAVIGSDLWHNRFGSTSDILGKTIVLNGTSTTIIGVMPPHVLPSSDLQIWTNLVLNPPKRRGPYYLTGQARLGPGVTMEQARADLEAIAGRIAAQNPLTNSHMAFKVTPLEEAVVGNVRAALLVLLGAVAFVLLIAAADVANLLLARAAAREKEFAVRAALGANRRRLFSQLLTESILLAAVGGLLGLGLAKAGVNLLLVIVPPNLPRVDEISLDGRVLFFTALISLASGILFGLAPAFHSSQANLNETLKESGRSGMQSRGRSRLRNLLVVSEVALSFVLLAGAGLMLESLYRLQNASPGIDPSNLLTMQIDLPWTYPRDSRDFYRELLPKVEGLPGVSSAGIGMSLPPNLLTVTDYFTVEGQADVSERDLGLADLVFISPDYFRTLGTPLVRGRFFSEHDDKNSPNVAIISKSLASRYWPNENPVGKRIKTGGADRPNNAWMEIVGVVGDIKYSGLEAPPEMALYEPYKQSAWSSMYVAVRTSGKLTDPEGLAQSIRREVWSIDKDLPVAHVRTMEQLMSQSVDQPRFRAVLLGIFALIALSLALVGIYGVIAYNVTQRTHEIGVRVALGAGRRDVLKLILGHGLKLTLAGVGIGVALALVLSRFLSSLLYDVKPTDPPTFIGIALLLTAVAAIASYIPTRRATKVDPMVALRYE